MLLQKNCVYSVVFGNWRRIFGQNRIFRIGNGAEYSVSSEVKNSGFGRSLLCGRREGSDKCSFLGAGAHLGAIYTCDFANESKNDFVYDFLIGVRRIIETLNSLQANRTRNRTTIRTQNRTRVDGPLWLHMSDKVGVKVGLKTD
jgi:hypothetical protein